jgi:hypothetical protein
VDLLITKSKVTKRSAGFKLTPRQMGWMAGLGGTPADCCKSYSSRAAFDRAIAKFESAVAAKGGRGVVNGNERWALAKAGVNVAVDMCKADGEQLYKKNFPNGIPAYMVSNFCASVYLISRGICLWNALCW